MDMESEKFENVLNMSLTVKESERMQSDILSVGYSSESNRWEIIVKYNGDLKQYESEEIQIEILISGYAIVSLPEEDMENFAALPEVEYIEKPKAFYVGTYRAKEASCILPLTSGRTSVPEGEAALRGSGVLIAIIDSGIDFYRADFRNENGSRILYLWDQSLDMEYTKDDIDAALATGSRETAMALIPHRDITGHGTAVAGIAAGSSEDLLYQGVASEADLIIVKMKAADSNGFPGTVELMRGVTYAIRKATALGRPLVINLSFGNSYGSHDGSSLIERFLDNAGEINKTVICVGSGNEGNADGHVSGNFLSRSSVEFAIGEYETNTNIQLWKHYADSITLRMVAPDGTIYNVSLDTPGLQTIQTAFSTILVFVGTPMPYSVNQEIFFVFLAKENFLTSGIWQLEMLPRRIVNGSYHMYLPGRVARSAQTRFLESNPEVTLTIPSTAKKVITVGAYDIKQQAYADFSGRGYSNLRSDDIIYLEQKPNIVAPGVNIIAPSGAEGYEEVTGTSFATPIVSGSCALLLEWGIVRRNDPYLYAEKIKAYLQKGASQMNGYQVWPNAYVGWGKLCLENSLP